MSTKLRSSLALALCLLALQGAPAWAGTLTITPKYDGTENDLRKMLFDDAIKEWLACLTGPSGQNVALTISVTFKDLGEDVGGGTLNLKADANGNPLSADMEISTNAIMYYGLDPAVPADKKDALTVMKHEIGHALGFAGGAVDDGLGYKKWNDLIAAGSDRFDPTGLNVLMAGIDANGRSHVSQTTYPKDLMVPSVGLGNRRHPSNMDFAMLGKAFGYQVCPEPSSFVLAAIGSLGVIGWRTLSRRRLAA